MKQHMNAAALMALAASLGPRSAEGRTLQAVSGGEHQLVNYNLGPWESWAPHKARTHEFWSTNHQSMFSRRMNTILNTHLFILVELRRSMGL